MQKNLAKEAKCYFYLKDSQGTAIGIADSDGSKVQHYTYSAFGKIISIKDENGIDISNAPLVSPYFTYTNRELDRESGLYFYRARYYDSSIGRFIQSDPHPGTTANPITFNTKYSYVDNSPANRVDPAGTFFFNTTLLAGAAAFFGSGEVQEIGRSWLFAEATFVSITASGGTGTGALKAISSTAGGSALAAGAYAGAQGGNFGHHFSHAFHNIFRISTSFLAISAFTAPGGIANAGGNGFQGSIVSNSSYKAEYHTGLTIGSSSTYSAGSASLAGHEAFHTLQFAAIAGFAGGQGDGLNQIWMRYFALGAAGATARTLGVPVYFNPFEGSSDLYSHLLY